MNKQRYFTKHDFERVSKAGHGPRRVGGFGGPSSNKRNTKISGGNFNAKDTMSRGTCDGETSSPPPGFSDEPFVDEQTGATIRSSKRADKNQGPKRFGSLIKHSVKEISTDKDIADLNELALQKYRQKPANLKTDTSQLSETRLGLLERHLFRRKFGYAALDTSRPGNAK